MIEIDSSRTCAAGKYTLEVRCTQSRVGDIARFCYYVGSNVLWVASPCDDDGVPVYPSTNEDGATRCDKIRVVVDDPQIIDETVNGILADLDEYIRSKKALANMQPAEVIVISQ
jgi:hypothetical protein